MSPRGQHAGHAPADTQVVGFARELVLSAPSKRQVTIGAHQVMELPRAVVAELRQAHPGALLDLTPAAVARIFGIERQETLSTLKVIICPTCAGVPRMTMCPMCDDAGRVYHFP